VLVLGVLPGVLLAVVLSLVWLLSVGSRPNDAVLGRVPGRKGFHNVADYPEARTIPGLLLYRFDSNLVFYNADYFKTRLRAAVAAQKTPVEWVVVDASSINVIDVTALRKIDELRHELAADGVSLYVARVKRHLERFFNTNYAKERRASGKKRRFQTLKPAIRAYVKHLESRGLILSDAELVDFELGESKAWREQVQPPRKKMQNPIPEPGDDEKPEPPS
jgi:MFS superfamily sulfate permease-like transporter